MHLGRIEPVQSYGRYMAKTVYVRDIELDGLKYVTGGNYDEIISSKD